MHVMFVNWRTIIVRNRLFNSCVTLTLATLTSEVGDPGGTFPLSSKHALLTRGTPPTGNNQLSLNVNVTIDKYVQFNLYWNIVIARTKSKKV